MKLGIFLGTALFVLGVLAFLIQLWFVPWSAETFFKIEITIGALFVAVLTVWFVAKEYLEDKKNKSGDGLDG